MTDKIRVHEVPKAVLIYDTDKRKGLDIEVDDSEGGRLRFHFQWVRAFRMSGEDCIDHDTLSNYDCSPLTDINYGVVEVNSSEWKDECIKQSIASFQAIEPERLHHYMLATLDCLFEVLADNFEMTKLVEKS